MVPLDDRSLPMPPARPTTMAEVRIEIERMPRLPDGRRRELLTHLDRLPRLTGKPLSGIAANAGVVRRLLRDVDLRAVGLTRKSLANTRSAVCKTLELCGVAERALVPTGERTPAWQAATDLVHGTDRWDLSRFAGFCSERGIEPPDVGLTAFVALEAYLDDNGLSDKPKQAASRARRAWNKAAKTVGDFPGRDVGHPNETPRKALPLEAFSPEFQADVRRWRLNNREPDPDDIDWIFDDDRSPRSLRPATVETRVFQITRVATALVRSWSAEGVEPSEAVARLDSLATLVEVASVERAARHMLNAGDKPGTVHEVLDCLGPIARYHVRVPEHHLQALRHLRSKLAEADRRQAGASKQSRTRDRSREALRPFQDPKRAAAFVRLPGDLMAEARRRPLDETAAIRARDAVAIAIATLTALRRDNIRLLRLDTHLHRPAQGEWSIEIPPGETKNRQEIVCPLHPHLRDLLQTYIDRFRPLFPGAATSPYLFPGTVADQPLTPSYFSRRISQRVKQRLGSWLRLHDFRKVGVYLWLCQNPGSYGIPKIVLAHADMQTTLRYYTGGEVEDAYRQFDAVILAAAGIRTKR